MKGSRVLDVEVEARRSIWTETGQFIYPTVHVPARKLKYIDGVEFWLFSISEDLRFALAVPGELIRGSPTVKIDTSRGDGPEEFVDVPVDLCPEVVRLSGGKTLQTDA